jgi:hypothetical protein
MFKISKLLESDIARFWPKVNKEPGQGPHGDCWEWTGVKDPCGYGHIRIGQRTPGAHRVMWAIAHGEIPEDMCVLHTCDNPACVNLDHLWLGTQADNSADKVRKGRARSPAGDQHWSRLHPERRPRGARNGAYTKPECVLRGEDNGFARLTAGQVREIRERYASGGCTHRGLAVEYGIGSSQAGRIVNRESWKHI